MTKYDIKTNRFNIFTGTRAETIITDTGEDRRVVCGHVPSVLASIATIKDIDNVDRNNAKIPVDVVMDSLQPEPLVNMRMSEYDFYRIIMTSVFKAEFATHPKTENPLIIVSNMTTDKFKKGSEFQNCEDVIDEVADLLADFPDSERIFTYDGNCRSNPKKHVVKELRKYVDFYNGGCTNNKGHNPFFLSGFSEKLELYKPEEIVIVGLDFRDEVFYSAIAAREHDLCPQVTVIPEMCLPHRSTMESVSTGYSHVKKHLETVLGVNTINNTAYAIASKASGSGLTIHLE